MGASQWEDVWVGKLEDSWVEELDGDIEDKQKKQAKLPSSEAGQ